MVGRMPREGRHLDGKPFGWEPREGRLTILDREEVLVGLARGDTLTTIARSLGRAVSTVSREVKRGGGRQEYSAWRAHEDAREQARRPKPFKLEGGRLLEAVATQLEQLWSPQEIAACLGVEYPDDPEKHVSHEQLAWVGPRPLLQVEGWDSGDVRRLPCLLGEGLPPPFWHVVVGDRAQQNDGGDFVGIVVEQLHVHVFEQQLFQIFTPILGERDGTVVGDDLGLLEEKSEGEFFEHRRGWRPGAGQPTGDGTGGEDETANHDGCVVGAEPGWEPTTHRLRPPTGGP